MTTSDRDSQTKPNLYLVGYRGSGKSTVAPLLAERLGFRCVDTDRLLEERLGEPISSFFSRVGEAEFRRHESDVVESVGHEFNQVISLGGGSILAPQNHLAIRSTGKVVWLNCSVDALAKRLTQDQSRGTLRPSLTGTGVVQEIQSVLRVREPIYRGIADLIVDASALTPEAITQEIVTWWNSLADEQVKSQQD